MTDFNDNLYDDFEEEEHIPQRKSKKSKNRTFLIAVGILGAVFLIAVIALIVFGVIILPQSAAERREAAAQINAQNTAAAMAATELSYVFQQQQLTPTIPPVETVAPTHTPVVVFPTETLAPGMLEAGGEMMAGAADQARTATVAALLTLAAGGTIGEPTSAAPTALPTAGFADDVGLPGMVGIAALLIGVIFLVRKYRLSTTNE